MSTDSTHHRVMNVPDRYDDQRYVSVACSPQRSPRFSPFGRAIQWTINVARMTKRSPMGVIPSALVEAGHTTNKDLDEKSSRPDNLTSTNTHPGPAAAVTTANSSGSHVDLSLCIEQRKKPTTKATNLKESCLLSSVSPPASPLPAYIAIVYAECALPQRPTVHAADFYQLGHGVRGPRDNHHPGWFVAWRELALDVAEELKGLFRGRPDPFVDLRGHAPIVVSIDVKETITPVGN